jgi:hypothetical protein
MNVNRVSLLDGELALGIYHDRSEQHAEDAIKLDFRERAGRGEWALFRGDQVRIGLNVTEAKALLSQLQAVIDNYEQWRGRKR